MSLALYLLWLLLNARFTIDVLLLGAVAVAAVMLFLRFFLGWTLRRELNVYRCIPDLLGYVAALAREIVVANLFVARVIRKGAPQPVIRAFRTKLKSRFARTLLANSITVTPGTVTLTCVDDALTVHCLMPELAQSLEDSPLERRLLKLEEHIHG